MARLDYVVPVFERSNPSENGSADDAYVAGLRNIDGTSLHAQIVVPAETVERAVLVESCLSVSLNPDGTFTLQADRLSNDILDAVWAEALRQQSLGSLLTACLAPQLVAMEDDPVADLKCLRKQLTNGLKFIDRALEWLGTNRARP